MSHEKQIGTRNYWNEYGWPIGSAVTMLRPLNHLSMGRRAQIENGQNVLELGAGYPFYQLYSNQVGPEGLFVSVDINQQIQSRSKRVIDRINMWRKKPSKDQLITADANCLPFADNTFDTVLAGNFTGGPAYTEEAFRVLRPNGRLISSWAEALYIPTVTKIYAKKIESVGFENVNLSFAGPVGLMGNWFIEGRKPSEDLPKPEKKAPLRTRFRRTIAAATLGGLLFVGGSENQSATTLNNPPPPASSIFLPVS